MDVPADTLGNRENLIMKLIRKSNAQILDFVKRIRLRSVAATLLGAVAGLSLTSNIIPSAMEFTGAMDSFSARWALGGYAVYSMIFWGVGGRAAQKNGSIKHGAIVLGFAGLGSGLLFTAVGIGTETNMLLTGGCAGLLYGAVGGMIIGDALREPDQPTVDERATGSHHPAKKRQKTRFFRFFK